MFNSLWMMLDDGRGCKKLGKISSFFNTITMSGENSFFRLFQCLQTCLPLLNWQSCMELYIGQCPFWLLAVLKSVLIRKPGRTRQEVQGSKFIFGFGSTCATRCKFLGAQLQILGAPTPKEYLVNMLQSERLRLHVALWAYSSSVKHNGNK